MRERDLIAQFFAPLSATEPGSFNLTDDAAQLTPPPGCALVITTDSVIEGVHAPLGATPQQLAQKLVRRNLSDLAAMGATPWRYFLNLHLPVLDETWLAAFSETLRREQEQFGMVLAGGDTSRGGAHTHLTMTCIGLNDGPALTRSGAMVGDDLYVSGTLVDAALGLAMLQQKIPTDAFCVARYERPEPRLELGSMLRGIATACMDISDGLLLDLSRICAASKVGAQLQRDALPLSPAAQRLKTTAGFWDFVLSGGDDYELLFTAPVSARGALASYPVTRIGQIVAGKTVRVLDETGADITPTHQGWEY